MLRRLLLALACCGCWAAVRAQALPPEVEAALARAKVPAGAVAMYVAPADGSAPPRLAHRIDTAMTPASVAKLVTTFAGLDLLGPAFIWHTPVYFGGPIQDGTLAGNLYIQGQGDPRLVVERLWLLLERVRGLGVKRIAGDIVLDRSAFDVPLDDPGAFDNEPYRPYNAAPDALLVNFRSVLLAFTPQGAFARVQSDVPLAGVSWPATVPLSNEPCGDWRAALKPDFSDASHPRFNGAYPMACGDRDWPLAYADPASYAARAVAGLWQAEGGELTGAVREGRVPAQLKPAFSFASPPLAEVVRDINKFSNNVMAQQLFLTLGLQLKGAGTREAAREAIRDWWKSRFASAAPVLENGSGLARGDSISARQLAQLLHAAWASPLMPELASSLPVPGLDGTLQRGRRNVGQAHLKTGSLRDVAAVAGYVLGKGGRRWVVVAIANHPNAYAARPAFDALVEWAARE
ncbi:MAG TPA: D-alanyl-D-alanine carboxypeptidase/D-alanyl-D-alanine-endopeptidase [Ramlibacter sp.]|uniref:D-alanyl-D-alanine carboxypeptidase/D-alanyl-D-alanine endopeptidase n=1 Tax=Ramlibacter sp. TaxID=1917967 RepID=UPI002BE507D4|nr:D-alanyl-D-alanine carboxypeptidase/D-alanyl-D-alanine-endopeptidase [Ramlibacter sp.]HVZ47127.1 D-alanyl-D-alanine carboxypeptidase/D-alanyl-D-alanine-endopeptidase [Ramlibacter sp.]